MLRLERLRAEHDLSHFSSGKPQLDVWLRNSAISADRQGTGRTYVCLTDLDKVAAYFTLAPHVVRRAEVPTSLGHGGPDAIPSILLAKLALDTTLHGQGLGAALLAVALETALDAMKKAGGRLIVVDAIDEAAASFYEHHGFKRVPSHPFRLAMKASAAAASLGVSWP